MIARRLPAAASLCDRTSKGSRRATNRAGVLLDERVVLWCNPDASARSPTLLTVMPSGARPRPAVWDSPRIANFVDKYNARPGLPM